MFRFQFFPLLLSMSYVVGITPAFGALFSAGATNAPPIMISAAAPERQALIIVPNFAGSGSDLRGALAQSDGAAYRDLLRLLGFSVTVVAVDTRPTLDIESRNFAATVKRDGEVAVFVLGPVIAAGGKLYVPASDMSESGRSTTRIATEGVALDQIFRRIQDQGPRELVAIVDECKGGEQAPSCPMGGDAVGDNSVILATRVRPRDDRAPVAAMASLRSELLPLMQEPDLSFFKLFERLKGRLEGTNESVVASSALSSSFRFLPRDFFAKLPTPCNRIDTGVSADTLKRVASLAPLVSACESAAQTWTFSNYFNNKLSMAREQIAFQKAVASCDDGLVDAYLYSYPNGSYRLDATNHKNECAGHAQADETRAQQTCDSTGGLRFDIDRPHDGPYLDDTSSLSIEAIDAGLKGCAIAAKRTSSGRRFYTQEGRLLAERAVREARDGRGEDGKRDLDLAVASWNTASSLGSSYAINLLGTYYNGTYNRLSNYTFVDPDSRTSLNYWQRSMELGNVVGKRNYAAQLLSGNGVPADVQRALLLLSEAARAGDDRSSGILGVAMYTGYPPGVPKNQSGGWELLKRSPCDFSDGQRLIRLEIKKGRRSDEGMPHCPQ